MRGVGECESLEGRERLLSVQALASDRSLNVSELLGVAVSTEEAESASVSWNTACAC